MKSDNDSLSLVGDEFHNGVVCNAMSIENDGCIYGITDKYFIKFNPKTDKL